MTREVTEESFLKDVRNHQMTIIRDDGVHRHIRMRKPSSGDMYFDIVTYPHFLIYSGDMGCYVFSRIDDMFQFFRSGLRDPARLQINESYWAEKLEATDRADGHKQYDPELLKARVMYWLEKELDEGDVEDPASEKAELLKRLEDEVLDYMHDEGPAREALADFEYKGRHPLQDAAYESAFSTYTFRFVWCLYAIVWTIRQYDHCRTRYQPAGLPFTFTRDFMVDLS